MKETTVTEPAKAAARRGRPKGAAVTPRDVGEGASTEARRLAAAILEVLAGGRTPAAAAQALGISLPRYYVLELRAVQAMLVACEPRPVGRVVSSESALAALRRECDQLRRDCVRQQTLLRAAQRSIGLTPPVTRPAPSNGKQRRQRRPTARALRVAARLQEAARSEITTATDGTAANA